jgi:hypothetical protein
MSFSAEKCGKELKVKNHNKDGLTIKNEKYALKQFKRI